jgi:hypothetical protein
MKIRQGFVSNSSSCSFIIPKKFLTEEQLDLIRNHQTCGEEYAADWAWELEETDEVIKAETSMDNFDFLSYLDKIEVKRKYIEIDDRGGW